MKERLISVLTSLTAKYVAVFVLLVAVPAIGISWYLLDSSYNDSKAALIREQQEGPTRLPGKVEDDLSGDGQAIEVGPSGRLVRRDESTRCYDGMNRIEPNGIAFYVDASGQVSSARSGGSIDEDSGESFKTARHKGVYRRTMSPTRRADVHSSPPRTPARASWAPVCFRRTGSRS